MFLLLLVLYAIYFLCAFRFIGRSEFLQDIFYVLQVFYNCVVFASVYIYILLFYTFVFSSHNIINVFTVHKKNDSVLHIQAYLYQ